MNNRIVALATGVASVALFAVALVPSDASAKLLASPKACPAQKNARADKREQERALRCLVEHIREATHSHHVRSNRDLERAAAQKAEDVARCGFTHTACGRPADAWVDHFGYDSASSWSWGENLASGIGRTTARDAVKGWLKSPPHRETMMKRPYEHIGTALERDGRRTYWVLELGCHGC